ncbi:GTP cyclohydrolase [Aegicerativicinus sediminis]|uniref:GTP cyclohydrolase n=1 Tax=Aegicerativicinus sediminis TaxID=2893202 RepID=UPI001E41D0DC|nr:GTP cyclohydrolase [Aegicerativicinus sediminis]
MLTLEEVKSQAQLKAFVKFPFSLYDDSSPWVPPIISQEMKGFDTKENPVFEYAEANLFVAKRDGKIVGRIAAIINWLEVKKMGLKKMRFGWFDFIDDKEVSKILLDKVAEIGRSNDLEFMEGPVGFSNLDKVGVVTEGFEVIGSMITWYNHPYYKSHYEAYDMEIEKGYYEAQFPFTAVDPTPFRRMQGIIRKRYNLKPVNFTTTKEIMPYVDEMFDLFNTTYARLSSFVEITDRQKAYFKKKFIPFVNPEYIKFVLDKDDKMIGFAIVLPSFAKALKKAKGKLFPFGFFHLLKAKKNSDAVAFYLIGILPEYQNKGVTAIIFNEFYNVFINSPVKTFYRTPELDENTAIHQLWKNFDPVITRRRKTYKKLL